MTSRLHELVSPSGGAALQQTPEARRAFVDDVLRNPVIAIVIAYCEALDLRLPRSVIRATLAASSEFPFLGLGSLTDAFDAWQVSNVALEARGLEDLPLPAIVVTEEAADGGGIARVFWLLLERLEREVIIRHPTIGETTLPLEAFLTAWTGYAFVADEGPGAEARLASEQARERIEDDEYRKSIRLIPDFLSRAECQSIIDLCEMSGRFETSGLATDERPGGEQEQLSKTRTSDSAFLPVGDPLGDEIRRKAAELLSVSSHLVEPLQCVRYGPGQRFMAHFDAGRDVLRTHTLLIYLNQGFDGGDTYFPEIDFVVRPRVGTALLFRNLDENGLMIPQSRHAGTPVLTGIKYACNLWVRRQGAG